MEGLDLWRLCDELSVVQAALLIVGRDPGGVDMRVEGWASEKQPVGYLAARTAIANALLAGTLEGSVVPELDTDFNGNHVGHIEGSLDAHQSKVDIKSLRRWLGARGLRTGFFFPEPTANTEYLDPNNPRYAQKLAAAVHAWEAVTVAGGKHPKQALIKWLREHAAEYGLSDEDGKPNETGIEEVAKVANWQPGGGAPRTP